MIVNELVLSLYTRVLFENTSSYCPFASTSVKISGYSRLSAFDAGGSEIFILLALVAEPTLVTLTVAQYGVFVVVL